MTTVDLSSLRSLLGDDETLVQRFIGIFKNQTPEMLAQIRDGLDKMDWENASIAAHSLKSQCRYFGLEALAAMAESIENNPAAAETKSLFSDLEKHLTTVLNALGE